MPPRTRPRRSRPLVFGVGGGDGRQISLFTPSQVKKQRDQAKDHHANFCRLPSSHGFGECRGECGCSCGDS